jgi:hypothetical protein
LDTIKDHAFNSFLFLKTKAIYTARLSLELQIREKFCHNFTELWRIMEKFAVNSILTLYKITSPLAQTREKSGHFWETTSPKSPSSESPARYGGK